MKRIHRRKSSTWQTVAGGAGLWGCWGGACRLITQDFLPHNEEQQSPQRMRCACLSAGSCVFNDET